MYLFMDIDGTLLPSRCTEPPAKTIQALKAAISNGHHLILCTGRTKEKSDYLYKYGFEGLIGSAGGYVELHNEMLYNLPMTDAQVNIAMDTLKEDGILRILETSDGMYSDAAAIIEDSYQEGISPASGRYIMEDSKRFDDILWNVRHFHMRPITEYDGRPVYKILLLFKEPCHPDRSLKALRSEYHFRLQEASPDGWRTGELIGRQFSKGHGIRVIMDKLGITASETIGFGDSENDLEMAEVTGCFVAMASAPPVLTELADYVCPDPRDGGIYDAFRHYGLI